jgi:hypothetical protein
LETVITRIWIPEVSSPLLLSLPLPLPPLPFPARTPSSPLRARPPAAPRARLPAVRPPGPPRAWLPRPPGVAVLALAARPLTHGSLAPRRGVPALPHAWLPCPRRGVPAPLAARLPRPPAWPSQPPAARPSARPLASVRGLCLRQRGPLARSLRASRRGSCGLSTAYAASRPPFTQRIPACAAPRAR